MYNDKRFVLPRYFIIGGNTELSVKLSSFYDKPVVHSYIVGNELTSEWLQDESGNAIIPEVGRFYHIASVGSYNDKYFIWTKSGYHELKCYFSMQTYSNQQQDPILYKECLIKEDYIDIELEVEETLNLYGKFIYQISMFSEGNDAPFLDSKQGLLVIGRNIDIANMLNMTSGNYDVENEDGFIDIVYEEKQAYVVGAVPFAKDWLSEEVSGDAFEPEMYVAYIVLDEEYSGTYIWQDDQYVKQEEE